jgi:hypothetical protein
MKCLSLASLNVRGYYASLGKTLSLPVNIRLGWKGLSGTNTLAYYKNPQITVIKSVFGIGPSSAVDDTLSAI